jgi:16S rRNA (cytosine967-C5)-methyltransferase
MQAKRPEPRDAPGQPGLAARQLAVRLVAGVLVNRQPLDQVLSDSATLPEVAALEPRDRGLARAVAATALRRQGELERALATFLDRGMPANSGRLPAILLTGAAQLLCLGMPAHAVVDLAVETTRRDSSAHRYAKLVNAVLRRVAERGPALLAAQDGVRVNTPDWLWHRWGMAYGADTARRIAGASLREAALDISVMSDGPGWAERLGGRLLPTGSIRLAAQGRIEDLPGYGDGAWWVQDAAAALITRLAGDVSGRRVADLCAAPGGKTAALAAAGASVTAVDVSPARLSRLRENLQRLHVNAEVVQADVATWTTAAAFDAVVLDAPCTATGTIRRHPDILRLKRPEDVGRMAAVQRAMLANAAGLVRPGGLLVYATCSLEPEEGQHQVEAFLAGHAGFERVPVQAAEIGAAPDWMTPAGDLRTLPFHLALDSEELSGMDGFFAARLRRKA